MSRVHIRHVSSYLPDRVTTNFDIESSIRFADNCRSGIPEGSLERLFGIRERRQAAAGEQASDLAAKAAKPIVDAVGAEHIGYMIFAAASADMIEPATANIVQTKLGLKCPVFDLKNACNSAMTAIQVASAMIHSGITHNVLVVSGEKLSDAVKYNLTDAEDLKKRISAYTFGDAGSALLIESSGDMHRGIIWQKMISRGQYWSLCQVPGGGSQFPHQAEKNYFEGQTAEMREAFLHEFGAVLDEMFEATHWSREDIRHVLMHQVSIGTFDIVSEAIGLPKERFLHTFTRHGNMAAASIPVALHHAEQKGLLLSGDPILLIGLGAGISVSITALIW